MLLGTELRLTSLGRLLHNVLEVRVRRRAHRGHVLALEELLLQRLDVARLRERDELVGDADLGVEDLGQRQLGVSAEVLAVLLDHCLVGLLVRVHVNQVVDVQPDVVEVAVRVHLDEEARVPLRDAEPVRREPLAQHLVPVTSRRAPPVERLR